MDTQAGKSGIGRREFLLGGSVLLAAGATALTYVGQACSEGSVKKIRLGVVGGNFGATFFFHEHPNCFVAAVTDLRADRRRALQAAYACPTAYDSFEEMCDKAKDLDAVAIFSEATAHVKHVRLAMSRGWHVLCACPACATVEEAYQLSEIVKKSGLRYMQAESSWYRGECILARNLFREGKLGELFYTEAEYYHDRGDLNALLTDKTTRFWNPDGTPSWRQGYPPLAYSTHATGLLVGVTGERITHVCALGWGNEHPFLEDNQYANPFWNESSLMRTSGGHMLRCNVFWLVAGGGERAQWFGDKASLWMANAGYNPAKFQARAGLPTLAAVPDYWNSPMLPPALQHPSHHGNSATFVTAEFINALVQEREPEINLGHSLAMTLPGLVGHASALKGGEQLPVPQLDA